MCMQVVDMCRFVCTSIALSIPSILYHLGTTVGILPATRSLSLTKPGAPRPYSPKVVKRENLSGCTLPPKP